MTGRAGLTTLARLASIASLASLAACTPRSAPPAPAPIPCEPPGAPMVRTTLYFGLSRAHGGQVSPGEWRDFLASEVLPRFGGLTDLAAEGQWRARDGRVVREGSRMVVLLHATGPGAAAQVDTVVARYKARFDQESVLREAVATCAAFQ